MFLFLIRILRYEEKGMLSINKEKDEIDMLEVYKMLHESLVGGRRAPVPYHVRVYVYKGSSK